MSTVGDKATAPTFAQDTIVSRAQDGDLAAFEQLVDDYQDRLFRLAYRLLGDRGEAEDIVQETMITAWRQLPALSASAAFHSWIYQIATRQCLSLLRTKTRRQTDVADWAQFEALPTERVASPGDIAESSARLRSLNAVLATLSPEQRICWVLKELHDMSYDEIATIVHVPVSTVRGRIARARPQLAKGMQIWR